MTTHGVKGSDVYDTTGKTVLDLSIMLNRGLPASTIQTYLGRIFETGTLEDKIDAFALAFQTRDVRGGKGERDLFYSMFSALQSLCPEAASATKPLIPMYGCWGDVRQMLVQFGWDQTLATTMLRQLHTDEVTPEDQPISLCAKWAPRAHGKRWKVLAKALARELFPGQRNADELYRHLVAKLNKRLETTEIAMCAENFSSLNPAKVPGRALKLYTKAFLNQPSVGKYPRQISQDLDRINAARMFSEHFDLSKKGLRKVNGANTVYPHELVGKALKHILGETLLTQGELDSLEAQWISIVAPIKALNTMGSALAMCDFSGSMNGDPLHVSMALGLIIAECNTGIFKDHILTFDSVPTLHKFASTGLLNRIAEVYPLAKGTSTDFQAAYNLLIQKMIDMGVPSGSGLKDVIVLTDMGFDEAKRHKSYNYGYERAVKTESSETHTQIVQRAFRLAGEQLYGTGNGWLAPRLVIWNLRPDYGTDFQATALETGVVQISGWSPSLLRVLTTKGADAMNPNAMLRAQLDDERYDPVRSAVIPVLTRLFGGITRSVSQGGTTLTTQAYAMEPQAAASTESSWTHSTQCSDNHPCQDCEEGDAFAQACAEHGCEDGTNCTCPELWAVAKATATAQVAQAVAAAQAAQPVFWGRAPCVGVTHVLPDSDDETD